MHTSYPISISKPRFLSATGDTVQVACTPSALLRPGIYNISCVATNVRTRAEARCSFVLSARQAEYLHASECAHPEPPQNGSITCERDRDVTTCHLQCNRSYRMTEKYPLLARGFVQCKNGTFDFQREYSLSSLPACQLAILPTYFQGSVSFYVGIHNCSVESLPEDLLPTVQLGLETRNAHVCARVRCDDMSFQCEPRANRSLPLPPAAAMKVLWTVQAKYAAEDYEDSDVSTAEVLLEQLQVRTYEIVTADEEFAQEVAESGGNLWQDSFQQSRFSLVCSTPGFTIEHNSGLCVPCDKGTFEENGMCHSCPENHYQDSSGETKCHPCPKHRFSPQGSTSIDQCTGRGEPLRDGPMHGSQTDLACSPNPCLNGGHCHIQRGGFLCLCWHGFRGKRCQLAATCTLLRCANSGTCVINKHGHPTCQCLPGWSGYRCLVRSLG